ncbi:MAG: hypothetical protein A3K16_05645 [Omnitrophica bacterium RIFCSPLOWO2_01_FULL_45_24]|nr:MAG: hypothetical protein A3K16_05645 [Omnitrophica bacterium RIFCSPLOWO2_01_FULL_45_24]
MPPPCGGGEAEALCIHRVANMKNKVKFSIFIPIRATIRESGELSDETTAALKAAIGDFGKNYFE